MEGIQNNKLSFLMVVVLGTIVNHLSISLITKSEYILGISPLVTFVYLGGILWGVVAIKVSKYYTLDKGIGENKAYSQYLEQLNSHDMLTNLPNRTSLEKKFKKIIEKSGEQSFKILFIDVDGFKIVNDTLGYELGDEVLKEIANRLKQTTNKEGELFHIRGDEFVLLLTKIDRSSNMDDIANRIIKAISVPFVFDEKEIRLTVSIGIAEYPGGGHNVDLLLQSAHLAVQRAKESGRNNYKSYDNSMNDKVNKKLNLINNLHKAIEREEFILHYQPQVESLTGKFVGLEALIRWESPELGMVSPAEFIPLAEETGLIIPIGDWVLKTACAQNKAWQDLGYKPIPVSVNISTLQFQEPRFVDKVMRVLNETKLDPKWLHLEITESVAIKDTEKTIYILDRLQKIGVKIALDDFGTGFSSLGYLNKFKINVLKIDSSFIRDIRKDEFTITKTIILLGKSLNMELIAEGVETNEQLDYLKEAGCDKIQGYLFSRPVPPNDLEKLLCIA